MLKRIKTTHGPRSMKGEYSRILSAAVVNQNFCHMLLSDPGKALAGGYSGEKFNLASSDRKRISTINAGSLTEFAAQLAQI